MSTLLLRLAAPLQSWGTGSYYDIRKTDYYPSKSGVVGMLAAALGRSRTDDLSDLQKLHFGIRIDNQGRIIDDFQVTNMGEKLNANLSHREYLSDAVFLVGFESSKDNDEFLQKIENAVKNPIYSMFLGRKSCPPTQPLIVGIRKKDLYSALLEEDWQLPDWRQKIILKRAYSDITLRIIIEDNMGETLVKDNPVSFNSCKREYVYRALTEKAGKIILNTEKDIYSTDNDFMKGLG